MIPVGDISEAARMLACAERDRLAAELEQVKRELANHKHALAQRDRDWIVLMVLIAHAVGTDDDREAADMGEVDEFDPWHALRTHAIEAARLRSAAGGGE